MSSESAVDLLRVLTGRRDGEIIAAELAARPRTAAARAWWWASVALAVALPLLLSEKIGFQETWFAFDRYTGWVLSFPANTTVTVPLAADSVRDYVRFDAELVAWHERFSAVFDRIAGMAVVGKLENLDGGLEFAFDRATGSNLRDVKRGFHAKRDLSVLIYFLLSAAVYFLDSVPLALVVANLNLFNIAVCLRLKGLTDGIAKVDEFLKLPMERGMVELEQQSYCLQKLQAPYLGAVTLSISIMGSLAAATTLRSLHIIVYGSSEETEKTTVAAVCSAEQAPGGAARPDQPPLPAGRAPYASAATNAAQPTSRAAALASALEFERRIALFGTLMHGLTQAKELSSSTWVELFQRLLSIVVVWLLWLIPASAPEFYLLHRTACVTGCRLVAVVFVSLFPSGALLPQLLIQIYGTWFVRSNSSLCSTQLLSDPLTTTRLLALHYGMVGLLVLGAPRLAAPALLLVPLSPARACEAFLSGWHILLGVYVAMRAPSSLGLNIVAREIAPNGSVRASVSPLDADGGPPPGKWGARWRAAHGGLARMLGWDGAVAAAPRAPAHRRRRVRGMLESWCGGGSSRRVRWREVLGVDKLGEPLAAVAISWLLGLILSG
eukprot:scaffold5.g895.t1